MKGEELLTEVSKAKTEARFLVTDGIDVRTGLVAVKVSSRDPGLLSKMIALLTNAFPAALLYPLVRATIAACTGSTRGPM